MSLGNPEVRIDRRRPPAPAVRLGVHPGPGTFVRIPRRDQSGPRRPVWPACGHIPVVMRTKHVRHAAAPAVAVAGRRCLASGTPGRLGVVARWRARRPRGAQQCEVWRTGALVHVGAGIRDARSGVHPPSIAHPGVWPSWPRPLMVPGCDVCPHATAGRGSERVERVSRRWRAPACPARGRCQRVTRQGDPLRRARWLQNLLRVVSACFDANFSGCVLSCLLVVRACRRASPVTRFGSRRPAWGH